MKKVIAIIIAAMIIAIVLLSINNRNLRNNLAVFAANEKAYVNENSKLKDNNRIFKFTIDQLSYFNDSLVNKLDSVRRDLQIKDKDLKSLQYLLSISQKKDTVIFRDTIFRDSSVNIDTTMGNKWYRVELGLRYPNTIMVNPSFISEKYIITNYKRETIKPPKRFFLCRWFQRKHKVVEVNVIENNPYIKSKKQKFIEIVK